VVGLQAALDLDKGGDLAANLNELYGYLVRRILHVNIHNDLLVLEEVRSLISEVRDAWRQVPSLLPAGAASLQH
jgi:flagellar protein FliS